MNNRHIHEGPTHQKHSETSQRNHAHKKASGNAETNRQVLTNHHDESYAIRNEDSKLMKSTIMNQSLNVTNIDIEDLEDYPKQEHPPPRVSNILPVEDYDIHPKTVEARLGSNYKKGLALDSEKLEHKDAKNIEPIFIDTPHVIKIGHPQTFPARIGKKETESQHIEFLMNSKDRLRLFEKASGRVSGQDLPIIMSRRSQKEEELQTQKGDKGSERKQKKEEEEEEEEKYDFFQPKNERARIVTQSLDLQKKSDIKEKKEQENRKSTQLENIIREKKNEERKEEKKVEENKPPVLQQSASGTSLSKGERTCKVCLETNEDETTGKFVHPCKCIGSVRFIHDKCLKTWIESQPTDPNKAQCELCHTKYKMKFVYRLKFTPKNAVGEGVVSLISGFCLFGMVVGLLALVVSLHITGDFRSNKKDDGDNSDDPNEKPDDENNNQNSVKIFITLVCCIFAVILSILLIIAWKEAFFCRKIDQWKIEDYMPSDLELRAEEVENIEDKFEPTNSDEKIDASESLSLDFGPDYRPRSISVTSGHQTTEAINKEGNIPPQNSARRDEATQNIFSEESFIQNRKHLNPNDNRKDLRKSANLEDRSCETKQNVRASVEERPSAFKLEYQERKLKMRENVLEALDKEQTSLSETRPKIRGEWVSRETNNEEYKQTKERKRTNHRAREENRESERRKEPEVMRMHPDYAIAMRTSPERANKTQRRKLHQPPKTNQNRNFDYDSSEEES